MTGHTKSPAPRGVARLLLVLAALLLSGVAHAQPGFSKTFVPATIGPGSVTTLRFDISNSVGAPVDLMAFTDDLPAGVTIATPAIASSTCGGTLDAPDGGGTITFADGILAANASCSVFVDVTSSAVGTHTNVSGDLTSSDGNSGTASADLVVATDRPGFSKGFSPASIGFGGRSTLTFTIDNALNQSSAAGLAFTDNLPAGVLVADPANAVTTCASAGFPPLSLTATPGSALISFVGGLVAGAEVCTVSVDVTAAAVGPLDNSSGELTSTALGPSVSSGKANATLEVTADTLLFSKAFLGDPVNPGGSVELEFTLTNTDRGSAAANIAFSDDLDAALSGLAATGLPATDACGAGSQLSGTTNLSFTGGNLAPGASCIFSVTLEVPVTAVAGAYPNQTSQITADIGGNPFVGSPASETLFVTDAPVLTKAFLSDPVGGGDSVSLEFTIANSSTTSAATGITFTDDLSTFLSGVQVTFLPTPGFCGAGSSIGFDAFSSTLSVANASLSAGDSCTFSVDLLIPIGAPAGTYLNTAGPISAIVDGVTQQGPTASDTLTVVTAPRLTKSFADDPVLPGATVTLEFTLSHDATAPANAIGVAFTDDLNAALSGLSATGLPLSDVCGAGSQISGTTSLSFTGGTLAPGASCTFSVVLQIPGNALPGVYTNTTSEVSATVSGVATENNPSSDQLVITGLTLSKAFTDDPAIPGGTVNLQFTLDNTNSALDATNIVFTDDLNAALSGLSATGLPVNDVCGAGSQLSGTTFLIFTGGALAPGASCTFSVTLDVPAGTADGEYGNTTSAVSADVDGNPVSLPPASDNLSVNASVLELVKSFTDDPVAPGGIVTLELTLTNPSATATVTDIAFTDDLDAALSGLTCEGGGSNSCGIMLGTGSLIDVSGVTLDPGASCTITLPLSVPAGATPGSTATNTTSVVAGAVGSLPVNGPAASDDLLIASLTTLSKSFLSPTFPGGTVTLRFVIDHQSAAALTDAAFSDDLDAVIPALVATGLPRNDVCGAGSILAGTSLLTLTNASVPGNGQCTFDVTLQVPAAASLGSFDNTSSSLFVQGLPVAAPAVATLSIEQASEVVAVVPTLQPAALLVLSLLLGLLTVARMGKLGR